MEPKYKWAADYAAELPDVRAKQSVRWKSDYIANGKFKTPSFLSSVVVQKRTIYNQYKLCLNIRWSPS